MVEQYVVATIDGFVSEGMVSYAPTSYTGDNVSTSIRRILWLSMMAPVYVWLEKIE